MHRNNLVTDLSGQTDMMQDVKDTGLNDVVLMDEVKVKEEKAIGKPTGFL
jgi:hypothetical protein